MGRLAIRGLEVPLGIPSPPRSAMESRPPPNFREVAFSVPVGSLLEVIGTTTGTGGVPQLYLRHNFLSTFVYFRVDIASTYIRGPEIEIARRLQGYQRPRE